jgi:DNA-binding IscR family transcriptional regulator
MRLVCSCGHSYVKRNSRFSVDLHALIQMAERRGEPAPSELLAACLLTNSVVVRMTMAGLRDAGLVRSRRGHRGGWILIRAPEAISLRDVYTLLSEEMRWGVRTVESPGCLVKQVLVAENCAHGAGCRSRLSQERG